MALRQHNAYCGSLKRIQCNRPPAPPAWYVPVDVEAVNSRGAPDAGTGHHHSHGLAVDVADHTATHLRQAMHVDNLSALLQAVYSHRACNSNICTHTECIRPHLHQVVHVVEVHVEVEEGAEVRHGLKG